MQTKPPSRISANRYLSAKTAFNSLPFLSGVSNKKKKNKIRVGRSADKIKVDFGNKKTSNYHAKKGDQKNEGRFVRKGMQKKKRGGKGNVSIRKREPGETG